MAYFSQDMKRERAPAIRKIIRKYGLRASLGVRHHSTFVLNIAGGPIDFIGNFNQNMNDPVTDRLSQHATDHIQVNCNYIDVHFTGVARQCLNELYTAMMTGNHDNSDIQTDYFDVGFYVDINIGRWDRPYVLNQ